MIKKCLIGIAPLLAVAAFAVAPAAAQAATELHTESAEGPFIPVNTSVVATSSNLKFGGDGEFLECADSVLKGEVTRNTGATNALIGIDSSEFKNAAGGTACATSFLGDPTAEVTGENFSWTTEFVAGGTGTVTGMPIRFKAVIGAPDNLTCSYEKDSLAFTWSNPLGVALSGQVMTLVSGSTTGCPPAGELGGTFTVKTDAGESIYVS